MKNLLRIMVLLTFFGQLFSVTVDGYAYLENQTNYRGINVVFQRVIPDSLELYRVSTDSTGYFLADVEPGYYDLTYSKNGFSSIKIEDAVLYSDQTLADQTLTARGLEGEIKGIITEGEYNVSDTLRVASGDSLIIEPGVTLNFNTDAAFIINGYLKAEGTETDSIIFKAKLSVWAGIVLDSSGSSTLSYSLIKNIDPLHYAVEIIKSTANILNSDIYTTRNGVYIDSSETNIDYMKLLGSHYIGGSYGIQGSKVSLNINNSLIKNFSEAIFVYGGANVNIENSIITDNTSSAIDVEGELYIFNSTIYASSIGVSEFTTRLEVYNCNIISTGDSLFGIIKNDFIVVSNSNIHGFYQNYYECGPYLGAMVTTNSNGDPCDAYGNISMDPIFTDGANGDFSLQSDSPCIDAGTNSISDYVFPSTDIIGNTRIWDGDESGTSIVDMGAYEFGSSIPVSIEDISEEIHNYQLHQNYPNPFNPVTAISYALPNAGQVELNVYNLQGQLVQSLVNGNVSQGIHKAEFSGADLT